MDATSRKERPDSADGNADDSNRRKEMDSFRPAIRSKANPCTKFFSTSGCRYGEDCHYLHYFPGGLQAVQQWAAQISASGPVRKLRICNKYNTAEGCKFGERCSFAHGQQELGKPIVSSNYQLPPHCVDPTATLKITVDASLLGLVMSKGEVDIENICRLTGARLSILDHEWDLKLKNIELEGTYDQVHLASRMVKDLIDNITASINKLHVRNPTPADRSKFKAKICDNFRIKGFCSYGNRCHFAHGESELQKGPS